MSSASRATGSTLYGYLYRPPGDGPFPAIVFNHGSEEYPGVGKFVAQYYLENGFVFFFPHRRGQGRSHEAAPYIGNVIDDDHPDSPALPDGLVQQSDDVIAAAAYVASLPYVDKTRVATIDSHLGLPQLDLNRAALAAHELRPFSAVAKDPIHLMMTAHILYPSLDPGIPATMSHELVTTILRGELGYRGAVVTDDIGMRAVSSMFDQPDACARVLSSGTDLIMICSHWTDTDRSYSLVEHLERARRDGSLAETTLAAADARIDTLLAAAPTHTPRLLDPEVLAAHSRLAPLYLKRGAVGQTVSLEEA